MGAQCAPALSDKPEQRMTGFADGGGCPSLSAFAGAQPPGAPRGVQASPSRCGSAQGCALPVLVVEDNPINQRVLAAFLRKRGYRVDVANDGAEALQLLAQQRYGLILMDLQMPVLDGYETARLIRTLPDIGEIPIVAVSAHTLNGEKRRCLEAGMNGYLAKPVDVTELFGWVERFIGPPGEG